MTEIRCLPRGHERQGGPGEVLNPEAVGDPDQTPIVQLHERVHDGRFIMGDGRSQTYLLTERLGQFRTHCPCGWRSEWADEPPYSALDEHQAQPLDSDDSMGGQ